MQDRSVPTNIASTSCASCHGEGTVKLKRQDAPQPCKCVLRAVFEEVFERFKEIATSDRGGSQPKRNINTYSRIPEEFMADFVLTANRVLHPSERQIFKFHFLLGADWKLCCRRLKIDKGNFYHAVYRIQAKLGLEFSTSQPYGLWPVEEYFGHNVRRMPVEPTDVDEEYPNGQPLVAPLAPWEEEAA